MVKLIQICIINSKCRIRYNPQISGEFSVENDLRQGDTLSPMLFNIALEYMVKAVLESKIEVKIQENTEVTIIAYADDIMIVAESETNLKTKTTDIYNRKK
jgi:hypothetical protein